MNTSKLLMASAITAALSLASGFVAAQASTGNVNEAGAKTKPDAGSPSQSNAADSPKPAGSAKTSNTTRQQSTAEGKGSTNTNEAGASNATDKPKAARRTTLINRDSDGKFVPRAKSNGATSVKENNEAGAKSTSGSQSQNNPGNEPKPTTMNK
jgi:hypothetical protein